MCEVSEFKGAQKRPGLAKEVASLPCATTKFSLGGFISKDWRHISVFGAFTGI